MTASRELQPVLFPEPPNTGGLKVVPGHIDLVGYVQAEMTAAVDNFKEHVADEPYTDLSELPPEFRKPRIILNENAVLSPEEHPEGWVPNVVEYSSQDPFQFINPGLTVATKGLIRATQLTTQEIRMYSGNDETLLKNPELAYHTNKRAGRGKNPTIITKALASIDTPTGIWINNLPDAEQLRPVAQACIDGGAVTLNKDGTFSKAETSKAFLAVVGGAGDGEAVRQREEVEKAIISKALENRSSNSLKLTSFGTGTGEPAMDTAIEAMRRTAFGAGFKISVNGIDINPRSLAVAKHLADVKSSELKSNEVLTFDGSSEDILSVKGIREAIAKTNPDIIEAVGLLEYVASDFASTDEEKAQRADMRDRLKCISAEEFYKTIWEAMPEGSTFVSGNMRKDSPEADYVTDGLGWPGIIQRDTKEFLEILRKAGIPAEAVTLYKPQPGKGSPGVYNIISIQKPVS